MKNAKIKIVQDVRGHSYELGEVLGEGGQGKVSRVKNNGEIIVKQIFGTNRDDIQKILQRLKRLPIPEDAHFATPIHLLSNSKGYIMNLVRNMTEISSLMRCCDKNKNILEWYSKTGGIKKRLEVMHQVAFHLNKIHSVPLVYGDISPNNIFISRSDAYSEVWFIDCDNLGYANEKGGGFLHTPMYAAPEVVSGSIGHSLDSDIYSFALTMYHLLSLNHPFEGKKVLGIDCEDGWDVSFRQSKNGEDIYSLVEKGEICWGLSDEDDSNHFPDNTGISPNAFLTENLYYLFEKTFSKAGRTVPRSRPSMRLWLFGIIETLGKMVKCGHCENHYIVESKDDFCPFCANSETIYSLERLNKKGEVQSVMMINDNSLDLRAPFIRPGFDYKNIVGTVKVKELYIAIDFNQFIKSNYKLNREELVIEKDNLPVEITLEPKNKKDVSIILRLEELK